MAFSYMVGEVERVDDHYVATRFFAMVGPLIPTGSMFVTSTSTSGSGRSTVFRYGGVGVRMHPWSVLLGYLRVWLPILTLAWPFLTHYGESVHFEWASPWIEMIVFFVLWILLLIFPGRLSAEEKARRRVLRQATGYAVDPKWLTKFTFEDRLESLKAKAEQLGFASEPEACLKQLEAGIYEDLAPLYARARYGAVVDPAWKKVAEAVWPKVRERGLKPMFSMPSLNMS